MAWGARELHSTAQQLLAGEPLIVVSSREPWVHELADDGSLSARHALHWWSREQSCLTQQLPPEPSFPSLAA